MSSKDDLLSPSEVDRDALEAASIGPGTSDPVVASSPRTPRWVWVWVLPFVIIVVLYMSRRILGPFIIAGVLAYVFSLFVDNVQERARWPRWVIVTLMYLVVLSILGIGIYFGVETLYQQTKDLLSGGTGIIERGITQVMGSNSFTFAGQVMSAHELALRITQLINGFVDTGGVAGGGLVVAREVGTRLLDSLLVLIVTFYLLLDGKRLGAYMLKFVPVGSRARTGYVAGRIHTVLGAYLRGQLILIVLMSVVSFLVLQFIFNVPYAIPLAIITGFLEILPLLGPAIAAALAAGVALAAHGTGAAIGVIIAYLILRQVEDQVVMPQVVGRAVDLHPVVTIFAVLAGGAMAGVLGMLLAVPVAAAIKVILDFLYPSEPGEALQQARAGIRRAEREAEEDKQADKEESTPAATGVPADGGK